MNTSLIAASGSPYNDLAIPTVMSNVLLITQGLAFGLFVLLFLAEAIRLQWVTMEHAFGARGQKPHLTQFLTRSIAIGVSLASLYQWTFLKMVSLCDHLAMVLANEDQWLSLIGQLNNSAQYASLFHITVPAFFTAAAFTLLQLIQGIFMSVRFVLLALLCAVGPLAWAMGVSELGVGALKGWFKSTWKVSFWAVIFALVQSAVIPLAQYAIDQNGTVDVTGAAVYAVVIVLCIYMIPTLTDAIFSDANFGTVAGAVMGLATYGTARAGLAKADSLHQLVVGKGRSTTLPEAFQAAKEALRGPSPKASSGAPTPGGDSASPAGPEKPRTR